MSRLRIHSLIPLLLVLVQLCSPAATRAATPHTRIQTAAEPSVPPQHAPLWVELANGGFESGDLTSWSVGGSAGNAEVLTGAAFSGPASPAPPAGSYFALLSSGPGDASGSAAQDNLDGDPNNQDDNDRTSLSQLFILTSGDVPAVLSFDWSFLTAESDGSTNPGLHDDFFQVTLNSTVILSGSVPGGGTSPFPDVGVNGISTTVTSSGATDGSTYNYGHSPFQTSAWQIDTSGIYLLQFLVSDQGTNDFDGDAGLLIDDVRLAPATDLEIGATTTPDQAVAGEPLVYEITVTNNGANDALSVVVTETLPLQTAYITETLPGGCTLTTGTGPGGEDQLLCDLGDLATQHSRSFQIEVGVDADTRANGTLTLSSASEVGCENVDQNPSDNLLLLETLLLDSADLAVTKMSYPETTVQVGETFTCTLFVDNLGPSFARSVVMQDDILAGPVTLLRIIDDPNRPDTCATNGITITCQLNVPLEPWGTIPGDGRWTVQIEARADAAQDISNQVQVLADTPDPDLNNNQALDFIAATAVADLSVTKTAVGQVQVDGQPGGTVALTPNAVTAGGSLTYTLTITNHGPSPAENVVLQDYVPSSIEVTSVITPGQGVCISDLPDRLTCGLGSLPPGSSLAVLIVANVPAGLEGGTVLENDGLVSNDVFDPDNTNNYATNHTTVDAWADLAIAKTAWPTTALPGQGITYVISVTNLGVSDVSGAVVSDAMPAAVTDVTWSCVGYGGASCTASSSGDIADTVDLPANGTVVYTVQGTLASGWAFTNTATVACPAGVTDPNPADNSDSVTNRSHSVYLPLALYGETCNAPDLVVESIVATRNDVRVLIRNQGNEPVVGGFWVDCYIDPDLAPRAVNQLWYDVGDEGLAWGVTSAALPLEPGEALLLTVGDSYYRGEFSQVSWPLPAGTPVYAQVDSYGSGSDYGMVLESHEILGRAYNNILGPVLSTADWTAGAFQPHSGEGATGRLPLGP